MQLIRVSGQRNYSENTELIFLIVYHLPNIEDGRKHAKELGYPFVIKIQVPVGGRGKGWRNSNVS